MPHIEETEKEEAAQEKREQLPLFHEKKKIAKRELCMNKKIERREQNDATFERNN